MKIQVLEELNQLLMLYTECMEKGKKTKTKSDFFRKEGITIGGYIGFFGQILVKLLFHS